MKTTISVTEDDIYTERDNREGDSQMCMVAAAVRRQLDLAEEIDVDISITDNHLGKLGRNSDGMLTRLTIPFSLPPNVRRRIQRWDQGVKTKPFTFEIEFPDDWREQLKAK